MSAKKVKSEAKNEEIVTNKLGLNWAKLSLKLGLKLEFEALLLCYFVFCLDSGPLCLAADHLQLKSQKTPGPGARMPQKLQRYLALQL